jgi:hypothetical protein
MKLTERMALYTARGMVTLALAALVACVIKVLLRLLYG